MKMRALPLPYVIADEPHYYAIIAITRALAYAAATMFKATDGCYADYVTAMLMLSMSLMFGRLRHD